MDLVDVGRTTCSRPLKQVLVRLFTHRRRRRTRRVSRRAAPRRPTPRRAALRRAASCRRDSDALQTEQRRRRPPSFRLRCLLQRQIVTF